MLQHFLLYVTVISLYTMHLECSSQVVGNCTRTQFTQKFIKSYTKSQNCSDFDHESANPEGSDMHHMQAGTKQVSKQASKPSFSLPSLAGKAQQAGKSVKGNAKQARKQAPKPTFSLPSVGGKASQVGKTAKIKAGSAPQKAKKAVSSVTGTGFFGTGSTRGKSAPAKQGGSLGTRSTRPGAVRLPP